MKEVRLMPISRGEGCIAFAGIGFLDKAREGILEALRLDPAVFGHGGIPNLAPIMVQ
jgi:hypothetical protein